MRRINDTNVSARIFGSFCFIPYHGEPQEDPDEIRRSATKSGTTHFHAYASAYIIYKHKRVTVFDLHVVCHYAMGRRGKHGIDVLYFAVLGQPWTGRPRALANIYGRRFGIESSYRLMSALRIRTTSHDPKLRLLFVMLAFALVNLWVFLSWTLLAVPRRGGRYLLPHLFQLEKFRYFLREAIHRIPPPVLSVSRPVGVF